MKRKKSVIPAGKRRSLQGLQVEIDIESLSTTGDGVGRLDGRVVFVPYTMPGDRVRVAVHTDKRSFLQASLLEVLEASVQRVEAPCKYFSQCGGCDWQHIPYDLQLQTKADQVKDSLERIGAIADAPVIPIEASPMPFRYRNRIQGEVRSGEFFLHRKNSKELVAVDACMIADQRINEAIKNKLASVPDSKIEIAVVDQQACILAMADRGTELGFRQVNTPVSERLANLVLAIIADSRCGNVYDFYCGRGGWTNTIAQNYPDMKVTGVDSTLVNIQAATAAAKQRDLVNVCFVHARVEDSLSVIGSKNSLCIVDPPRSGLDPLVTTALCKKRPADLVYISCHPATLARDLKILTDAAYRIKMVQPLDMFPQTSHVECLVHLQSGSVNK